jgi:myo-inositol-1(or 4)-monophosphatase
LPQPPAIAAIAPPFAAQIEAIVREAGDKALAFFRHGAATHAEVNHKHGGSPVTEADLLVDRFLREKLAPLAPEFGWLSEESADSPDRLQRRAVFIVDPIDGTRGFAAGDPCWAVCVAVVVDGGPVYGIVHAPALQETFVAHLGGGAFRNGQPIGVSTPATLAGARLAAPETLLVAIRQSGVSIDLQPRLASLAMRILRVASGEFDAALAAQNAYDWDIAAADLILREAGGVLSDFAGHVPCYNRPAPQHPALAAASPGLHAQLINVAGGGHPDRIPA